MSCYIYIYIYIEVCSNLRTRCYKGGHKLSGLLFLQDINMRRMMNTALSNLDMFHHLCGDQSLKNVMFLTTKWDKASTSFARKHEGLTKNFWSGMIELGCS